MAEPNSRQQIQTSRIRPAIDDGDTNQDVFDIRLGVLDENIKIAVLVEDARVQQLVLRVRTAAPLISVESSRIGETRTAGTCRDISCRSAWPWNRGRSSTP